MKDVIVVNISPDHNAESGVNILGREGEGNSSRLEIAIPEELRAYDAYLEFKKPNGEKLRTPKLEVTNGVAVYDVLPYILTEHGELEIQLVLQGGTEEIWKSSIKRYAIQESINAIDDIPDKEDFISEAQKILDAFSGEVEAIASILSEDANFIDKIAGGVGIEKTEINANGELVITYTDGKSVNLGKVVGGGGGGLTAEQLTQFNALVDWHKVSTYETMTATMSASPSICEIGSKATITFTWRFKIGNNNAELSSLTFNGSTLSVTTTSKKVDNITSAGVYTVKGKRADGDQEEAEAKVNVYFYNKYYFGCASEPTTITSDFIKGLNYKSEWASSHPTFTALPFVKLGEYIWYAYPARLETSRFKSNGFNGGFNEPQIVKFKNSSGYEEDYYVYRSTEASLGEVDVQVL